MTRAEWIRAMAVGLALIGGAAAPSTSRAHDGPHSHGHDHPGEAPAEAAGPKYPTGLILPPIDGPKPWSDAPHLNHPDRFHIAIMTDRTGGHRPGIWEKGVEKVNLLRPEFVVSVGDLIEGYTEEVPEIERQWEEFLGFIETMEMKFFFVPGNHDLTNPTMHRIWREHFGREWYSFDYKGVHFVAINSEDPQQHLGEEQLAWLEEDLAAHADARWTLLFLHKPLWTYAEREMAAGNPDPTNWKRVEAMLGDRPHTVFAGHVHHYVQYDRNGMNYYHLATTGGGSQLRGVPYGEFDHVTWLTMEPDGPRVSHLLLDGVLAPDTVTEKGIARFREFLTDASVQVAPILITEGEGLDEGRIDVRLANDFDVPVTVSGRIEGLPLRGLTVDPASLELTAEPGEAAELSVRVAFGEPIPFEALAGTVFTATITGEAAEGEAPLKAEQAVPVVIDRGYTISPADHDVALDGRLDEWESLRNGLPSPPMILGAAESWTGPGDADLSFDLAYDDEMLYLAARVLDEAVVPGEDRLEVLWDPRPMDRRVSDPRFARGGHRFTIPAPAPNGDEASDALEVGRRRDGPTIEGARAASRQIEGGYEVELAMPLSALAEAQDGADWSSFQLSVVVSDVDESGAEPARVLWRGTRDVDRSNARFGHFVRRP
ncbi:metallophosphoesterase [Tautonia marina]|uniref:metallophosphoesterase n=1 Tax=Tautonia marina TaxID=2653855 RepID=UPI0013759DD2|nr:metallophosphoesterase [Tautonia marina]